MAQRVTTRYVDDLEQARGREIDAIGTTEFALDNHNLEIDLSADNRAKLDAVLAPYIAAGRRRAGGRGRARRGRTATVDGGQFRSRAENQQIRDWAVKRGLKVSARGRIPVDVVDQYDNREQD
jgi:hypothetical protein